MCSMTKEFYGEDLEQKVNEASNEVQEPYDPKHFKKELEPENYCITNGCYGPNSVTDRQLCIDCDTKRHNADPFKYRYTQTYAERVKEQKDLIGIAMLNHGTGCPCPKCK